MKNKQISKLHKINHKNYLTKYYYSIGIRFLKYFDHGTKIRW